MYIICSIRKLEVYQMANLKTSEADEIGYMVSNVSDKVQLEGHLPKEKLFSNFASGSEESEKYTMFWNSFFPPLPATCKGDDIHRDNKRHDKDDQNDPFGCSIPASIVTKVF